MQSLTQFHFQIWKVRWDFSLVYSSIIYRPIHSLIQGSSLCTWVPSLLLPPCQLECSQRKYRDHFFFSFFLSCLTCSRGLQNVCGKMHIINIDFKMCCLKINSSNNSICFWSATLSICSFESLWGVSGLPVPCVPCCQSPQDICI